MLRKCIHCRERPTIQQASIVIGCGLPGNSLCMDHGLNILSWDCVGFRNKRFLRPGLRKRTLWNLKHKHAYDVMDWPRCDPMWYTYICTYVHMYTPKYIPTHLHTYIHTYICMYVFTYICTYIHMYICTYIHTYKHTYIHTYTHTYNIIH